MTGTLVLTGHTLRPDRCVIEVTARLLGLPLARARFQALSGELTKDRSLTIVVDPASLRTPLLGRALRGPKGLSVKNFPTIGFEAQPTDTGFSGTVTVRRTSCALALRTKTKPVDEAVIIWGRGRIGRCQPRTRRLNLPARLLGRRHLHVEIAAEFSR